jgi:hypothetical protein
MMAKVKAASSQVIMVAFGGRQYVKNELRQVPAGASEAEFASASGFLDFEEVEAGAPPAGKPISGDLSELKVKVLRAMAKELGLTGYSGLKKDDLILMLLEAGSADSEEDADDPLTRSEVINEFGEDAGKLLIDAGFSTVDAVLDASDEALLAAGLSEDDLAEIRED